MKRILLLILPVMLAFTTINAQYTQQITTVKAQAKLMADAAIKRDYKTLMPYLELEGYPKGKLNAISAEKVLRTIQTADLQMTKQGTAIESITFGDVLSIVKVGFEFQCTLQQIKELKMQFGKAIVKSTLLAFSKDNGASWKFVDATGRDKNEMRKLIPRVSDRLFFPNQEPTKFINDVKPVR